MKQITDQMPPRTAPPRAGEVWRKNGSDRTVKVEETDSRWATVRNVLTGRLSRIELYTFNRAGKAGWTRTAEAGTQTAVRDLRCDCDEAFGYICVWCP